MISPKICHCIHYENMSQYVTVSTTNAWDTKYATVSDTWARKDTVTSYFTKYTLCTVFLLMMLLSAALSAVFLGGHISKKTDILGASCDHLEHR